jgi:hypothetical protein
LKARFGFVYLRKTSNDCSADYRQKSIPRIGKPERSEHVRRDPTRRNGKNIDGGKNESMPTPQRTHVGILYLLENVERGQEP